MEKYQIDFDLITPQDLTAIAVICSKIFRNDSEHTHWSHHIPHNTNYYFNDNEITYRPRSYRGSLPYVIKREEHPAEFAEITAILNKYQKYSLINVSECKLCNAARCKILNVLIQSWTSCADIIHLDDHHPGYKLMKSYIDGSASDEYVENLKYWIELNTPNDLWGCCMQNISLALYNTIRAMPNHEIIIARSMRKGYNVLRCVGDCTKCDIVKDAVM